MIKISKKQIESAEEVIYKHVQDPYARHDAISQLYWQVKLLKKLGNIPANDDGPVIALYIRGGLDLRLSRAVSEVLGL